MPATAIAVKECLDRVRPNTWRFDLTLRMPLFSSPEEVCVVFRSILDDAQFSPERCSIHKLKQCSFAYGVLEGDVAKISGYLHASNQITEAAAFEFRNDRPNWVSFLPNCPFLR